MRELHWLERNGKAVDPGPAVDDAHAGDTQGVAAHAVDAHAVDAHVVDAHAVDADAVDARAVDIGKASEAATLRDTPKAGRRLIARPGLITAAVTAWWGLNALVWIGQVRMMRAAIGKPAPWPDVLRTEFASAALWVPATLALLWCVARQPIERDRWARALSILLPAIAGVVVYRAAAVLALNDVIGWYATLPAWDDLLVTSVLNNVAMCWLIIGVAHALVFADRSRARERQTEELQRRLTQARLDALSAQLNPHFLFNALNSIAEMVHHDASAADRMLVDLGALLRHSLESSRQQHTPLREELGAVECYIGIERVRLGERLQFHCKVDRAVLGAQVPRLMLQPLVENAVSHAIAHRASPGTVEVHARREGDQLVLEVHDDGADEATRAGFGVGLANTRARLQALYGHAHDLGIHTQPGHGTRVRIALPLVMTEPV